MRFLLVAHKVSLMKSFSLLCSFFPNLLQMFNSKNSRNYRIYIHINFKQFNLLFINYRPHRTAGSPLHNLLVNYEFDVKNSFQLEFIVLLYHLLNINNTPNMELGESPRHNQTPSIQTKENIILFCRLIFHQPVVCGLWLLACGCFGVVMTFRNVFATNVRLNVYESAGLCVWPSTFKKLRCQPSQYANALPHCLLKFGD